MCGLVSEVGAMEVIFSYQGFWGMVLGNGFIEEVCLSY